MSKPVADPDKVKLIRQLAGTPERVRVFRTAKYDLMGSDLTKDDVCGAICDWIDAGEEVKKTIIHTIPDLIAGTAYEMKPRINNRIYYVKVAIERDEVTGECMLILSTHLDN